METMATALGSRSTAGDQVMQNLATIAAIEQATMTRRSIGDRVSGVIARFVGSMAFVALHASWFAIWIAMNWPTRAHPFDPYPYNLLTLIVALEAIFLSTFVLISQNRMTRLADRRTHLDLQINLLAEAEMTKVLKTLRAITDHLNIVGANNDDEMRDLSQTTDIADLAQAVDDTVAHPAGARPPAPRGGASDEVS
jgi:uncharacterized membrane protein